MIMTAALGAQSEDVLIGAGQNEGSSLEGRVSLAVRTEQVLIAEGDSFGFRATSSTPASTPLITADQWKCVAPLMSKMAPDA